ncbi:F-box protein At3g07870-like [Papaver somniferum]|uniref:F-box protein At3g07870-like n=1 Tax=Papaver somniferum TaxID=3469 RepID=UPI000E6F4AEE|nr:F-box protein At3g07870-like [Papaver somniferum]
MVAFGYDYKNNDCKLLAGCDDPKLRLHYDDSVFEVCSLESNSWNTIVLVSGDLHWLAETNHSYDINLVSQDICKDIFKQVELPIKRLEIFHPYFHRLGVLKGCLCLVAANSGVHEVWVMENYGVRESWTKRYTVNNKTSINVYIRLLCSLKSGKILFWGTSAYLYLYSPNLYSPEDDKVIKLKISSLTKLYEQECYFESLVSLKSGTYVVGDEQMEESDTPGHIQLE